MSPLQLSVVCPLQFGPSEWYSGSGSSQAAPVGPTCLRQIRGPGLSKPARNDRCRLEKNATQMPAISGRLTAHIRAAHVHRVRQPDVFVEAAVGGMEAWGRPQVPCRQRHSQSAFATAVFDSIDRQGRWWLQSAAGWRGLGRHSHFPMAAVRYPAGFSSSAIVCSERGRPPTESTPKLCTTPVRTPSRPVSSAARLTEQTDAPT